mgnify:CR=1 FL=1
MERIGVFVCHCGTNIAGTVDVAKVAEELGKVNGVVYSTHYTYMCSSAGQKMIEDHIKDDKLTGVVLCSCSPRMHEKTFRACAERAGLNPYKVEVANIREQTSWVLKDVEKATEKAIALGKAAVAKSILDTPLTAGETPVTKRALVIGGGIAGITAALDIADAGFPVDIVEKSGRNIMSLRVIILIGMRAHNKRASFNTYHFKRHAVYGKGLVLYFTTTTISYIIIKVNHITGIHKTITVQIAILRFYHACADGKH